MDTVLNQRYRINKILGQGAMGIVYEVLRLSDGRRLAAKVLSGHTGRQDLARFAREGQLLARLNHPNLVGIFDVDLLDNRLAYLVMELVEGGTLMQHRAHYGQQSFALTVIGQISSALSQVHAAGIVHRDLKPANILLAAGDEIQVKLADFGVSALVPNIEPTDHGQPVGSTPQLDLNMYSVTLDESGLANPQQDSSAPPGSLVPAVQLGNLPEALAEGLQPSHGGLTQTGVIMGTPLYMAPELVKGAKLARPASDIFSLGVVAYELLTGELPSPQPPIFLSLRSGQRWYAPLSNRCPDLPIRLVELIERCLDAAPERRPTAQVICDALSAAP
jgi:serine/threonine-protein kinase